MNKIASIVIVLSLATLGLAGCGGDKVTAPEGAAVDDKSVTSAGTGVQYGPDGEPMNQPAELEGKRRVYFEFDSFAIDEEGRATVQSNVKYLLTRPNVKIVLEGHCDERGTREYNLALGEKRGKAVAQLMQALGVPAERIQVISYGEERPAALGHNESAWKLNRRVELLYGG